MSDAIDLLRGFAGKGGGAAGLSSGQALFGASILTTYNAYLPFYEEVVLRRLVASGCQHNVLLMDARDLARSFASASERPRLAGQAYTLIPIHAPRAFHPKVALLVGEKRARVFVGSHNATLSGFGHNRELTTRFEIKGGAADANAPIAQGVWAFLQPWLQAEEGRLPPTLLAAVQEVADTYAPWLMEARQMEGDKVFFGTDPMGPGLWEKVRPHLPAQARRITVLGPFFDQAGAFLGRLNQDLRPGTLAVGIEPKKAKLCGLDNLPAEIRFHDASGMARGDGYLHAKALLIEGLAGETILVTGSANPSHPAWADIPSERNAEAVILHRGAGALELAEALGMLAIPDLPVMGRPALEAVLMNTRQEPGENREAGGSPVGVAEARTTSLFIPCLGLDAGTLITARVTLQGKAAPVDVSDGFVQETGIVIPLAKENCAAALYVEVQFGEGRSLHCFVHHPAAIAKLGGTRHQREFRACMEGLDGGDPDLATLVRLAGKLIFPEADKDHVAPPRAASSQGASPEADEELGPLTVPATAGKGQPQAVKATRSSNLSFLIDLLIHRLGAGLTRKGDQLESQEPNEEELVGSEEDPRPAPEPGTGPEPSLLKSCQAKVGTLVRRMVTVLEGTTPALDQGPAVMDKLLAVLAVLREIRAKDEALAQVTDGQSLVPVVLRKRLFEASLAALFGKTPGLYAASASRFGDDESHDRERLLGLLLWLGWDSGLDLRGVERCDPRDDAAYRQALLQKARLFELAVVMGTQGEGIDEAHQSSWRTSADGDRPAASQWIATFMNWSKTIALCAQARWTREAIASPARGDLAGGGVNPRLRVVLDVKGDKVHLADLGANRPGKKPKRVNEITFQRKTTAFFRMPAMPGT